MLVLFFLWVTHVTPRWFAAPGLRFFSMVMWIDVFIFSVVGLSYFASAITEEKESDTLGLLRMTNLSALSILMGKSTSRLLGALFILAAQLPFTLVAVTMGGLAVHQVLAGFFCLLAYVFFLSNIGLFCSVVAKRNATATLLSAALLIGLLVPPWLMVSSGVGANGTWFDQLIVRWATFTPFIRLAEIMWTGFDGTIFSSQVIASLVGGVFFFVLAWLLFDRFADPTNEKPRESSASLSRNDTPIRGRRSRRPTVPALRWKDYHYVAGGRKAVIIKTLLVGLIIYLCLSFLKFNMPGTVMIFAGFASFFTTLFLALCLALDASRIFKKEREQQALSSLMTLPFSVHRLIWQKTIGCMKSSWPAFGGVGLSLAALAYGIWEETRRPQSSANIDGEAIIYPICFFGHAVFTALLLPVFVAWLSLRMRWGALPVGATIWFLGSIGAGAIVGAIAEEASIILLPILSFGLLAWLWMSIPQKLEELAAEE
jgi:hypothetical protein